MAGDQYRHAPASELDPHDPQFPRKAVLSSREMQCELRETIAATRKTITSSKVALAEVDRVFGKS